MQQPDSHDLLHRFREGDREAARELFDRYVCRLIALARSRISPKLARRIDPEDVVQSAYRSFFLRAASDEITLRRAGDLWRLLAAYTVNKLRGHVEHHSAQRRALDREYSTQTLLDQASRIAPASSEPDPEHATMIADELHNIMATAPVLERRVLEARLQGATIGEISADIGRSERTVRRLLKRMRGVLEARLLDVVDPGTP